MPSLGVVVGGGFALTMCAELPFLVIGEGRSPAIRTPSGEGAAGGPHRLRVLHLAHSIWSHGSALGGEYAEAGAGVIGESRMPGAFPTASNCHQHSSHASSSPRSCLILATSRMTAVSRCSPKRSTC